MGEFIDTLKNGMGILLGFVLVGGLFFGLFLLFLLLLGWATG